MIDGAFQSSHVADLNTVFIPLSTARSPWNKRGPVVHNQQMVNARKPMPTVQERLAYVRQQTGIKVKGHLAKWVGANSPQALSGPEARNSLSRELAIKIARTTGASLDWLLMDQGAPFPNGATPFPGAIPDSAESRLQAAEAHLDALSGALAAVVRVLSVRPPGAAQELVQALRGLSEDPGSPLPELGVVIAAAEEAAQLAARATQLAAPAESGGKPPRKGR